jgi:hypothetical protein
MTELTKQELLTRFKQSLTVGKIKEFCEKFNVPDTAKVLVQIIDEKYFEGGLDISGITGEINGKFGVLPEGTKSSEWPVYLKKGESYYWAESWNKDIDDGKYFDKDNYPDAKPESMKKISKEDMEKSMDRYSPVHCCVYYKDDPDILFIDLHY